ncbi:NADP-dependent oxidoreductase [Acidithrix sp. C25]|uniref:NADP-dependent oxidoreductase n=1 Tax=Acidithrix sp. C25 TaxID=1671482 RepID=UPI000AEAF19D|nr:NADP-dependent oxidoreductase [Acidithrix sp. C25]CAG4926165.1 unnamed protein product [Acidithrix sp. C25]
MKAIYYENYGDADVLQYGEVPEPKVGPDSVLVDISATSVNPVDWKITAGYLDQVLYTTFPIIPGWDASGVVAAKGPAASEIKEGDEVYGYIRMDFIHAGTFAERIAAPIRTLALKPKNLTFAEAACVPLAGLTAYQGLVNALGIQKGDTVFISAGAGGVGTFAIQIAKSLGANVIASASPLNHDFIASLGAEPVTYGADLIAGISKQASGGLDAYLDLNGGPEGHRPIELLKQSNRVASIADASVAQIGGKYVFVRPSIQDLNHLTKLIESEQIRPIVTESYALKDSADAFKSNMSGHTRGKISIVVK